MKKNIILKISFILFLAFSLNAGVTKVVVSQDFEDESIFQWGQAFDLTGIGDGTTSAGLWKNYTLAGNWTPKVYYDNSPFSEGKQCVNSVRGSKYGSGCVLGYRTNDSVSGNFISQISLLVTQPQCQFSLYLVDASKPTSTTGVGIAFYSGTLHLYDNKVWKPRSSGVALGEWFKLTIVGNTYSGTYSAYVDFGSWQGDLGNASFDVTGLQNVAGLQVMPWVAGYEVYLDDFNLMEGSLPLSSCSDINILGFGSKKDFNNDCYVNFKDFAVLSEDWLSCMDPADAECITLW
ncbi:MAG: hypothetical protein ABFD79_15310 [Phycisphaerales bacterium]